MAKPGSKIKPLRWTAYQAACEFSKDYKTIVSRLNRAGHQPDADGCYTTEQIVDAIFSTLEREKIRLTAADANIREMEESEKRLTLVSIDEWVKAMAGPVLKMKQLIKSLGLDEVKTQQICEQIEKLISGDSFKKSAKPSQ